jgi:hypothetical protein
MKSFSSALSRSDLPELRHVEDGNLSMRTPHLRLKIELIPRPLWGQNMRAEKFMGVTQWRKLRATLLEKAKPGCAICDSQKGSLQGHEEWDYVEGKSSGIAVLKRINLVCQDCHSIHHIGRTHRLLMAGVITKATWDRLIEHFLHVNNCDMAMWEQHGREAKSNWDRRSKLTWTIDFHSAFRRSPPNPPPAP